jgi:hypothetical protein
LRGKRPLIEPPPQMMVKSRTMIATGMWERRNPGLGGRIRGIGGPEAGVERSQNQDGAEPVD